MSMYIWNVTELKLRPEIAPACMMSTARIVERVMHMCLHQCCCPTHLYSVDYTAQYLV